MCVEEPLETRDQNNPTLSSDALDWGKLFVKHLKIQYEDLASRLPEHATDMDFGCTMVNAMRDALLESGIRPSERIALQFQEAATRLLAVDEDAAWDSEKNARRMELIDRRIEQAITPEEAIELERLTLQMRAFCDNEETIPLEGARRLYRRLLGDDDS
jgi:hypothetical protein